MPSFLMIQWGIVGFFVVIHFLIGFLRGSSKSTYFTIVSIIMTVVTLLIVASISFSWVFGFFSLTSLLQLAQNYTGNLIPAQYITYLEDPAITGFIVAIMDLALRIVAFFVLYPIIKFSLTITIFRPIWKHGIKKAILKKQNADQEAIFNEKDNTGKKFVPSKKLKKNIFGRLFGGTMGAVRGFIVAFIFLIPVLVLSSYVSQVSTAVTVHESSNQTLSSGNQELITIPSEIQSILDNINEMNQSGLASFTKDITVNGRPIDQYIFNRVFTTQVKDATDQVTQLNFGEELEGIFGIAGILIDGGYLDDDFDFGSISSENLEDIEQIFTYVSQSDLLNFLIPFATEYGLKVALTEFTDYENPYDDPDAAEALDTFTSIDWSEEFMNVYGIIEAVLEFGSVDELMNYADNPELLLEMTPTEATSFTNIIRAFGEMQTLVLINAGINYGITQDVVKSKITWVDPLDVEDYLSDRLGFISDNPDFFIGEDGEISRFASLIETIFTDEYGDVDLTELYNSVSDPAAFLDAQNPEWIGAIIDKIVELQIIVDTIPIGVDYGMYTVLGEQVEEQLAEDIQTALNEVEWDAEILNVGDIYTEALQLGLATALGAEADTFGFIDEVVANHMDSMRAIVTHIFEDSQLVNVAIEIASPAIVDRFVTDEALKDIINETLVSDSETGVVDFNFGQEVNSFLTILESVYGFTTASELKSFSTLSLDGKVELFSKFGTLTDTEFTDFEDAFKGLQILDRLGVTALDYAKTHFGVEELYVPTEVNLGEDISSLLGLAYYAAKFTYDQSALYTNYEYIDFAPLLADETFRSYLMSTDLENHSNLIFTNIAYNIQRFSENEAMSKYIAIPTLLKTEDPESAIWETEVNAFLGAIFDIGASFEDSTIMRFSAHDLLALSSDTSTANMELFTQFADITKATDTFGSLDSSQILRTSLVAIIDSLGESTVSSLGFALTTPDIAMDGEMLAQGMIVELINGLAIVAEDAFETMNISTLADISTNGGTSAYLNAFSELEDESLDALGNITIMRGIISDALQNPDMQTYLVDTINTAQSIITVDNDFFAVDPILLDVDGALKPEEFSGLLISIRSLGITDTAALSSLGVDTFTRLLGRNVDNTTGEDDFDRVLGSGYLYIMLDKVLQLDAIGNFVSDTLGTSLGTDMSTFDLTLPDAMLGNDVDHDEIEIDRIPKEEFRRMINSLDVLGDLSTIGLDTFSNLVDPSLPEDDFSTFIASDFIYVVLARLFENEGFGSYISDMLGGAFGDDPITLTMGAPLDAKGTSGVEDGLMTRYELRRLMISFDMLGLSDGVDISIATIMDMIGANEDLAGEDDFDRFLLSKYLDDKISQLLLSQQVIELIAAGQYDYADFVLPASSTTNGRLTNQEIYDLFSGLKLLGLDNFDNVDIGLDSVTSLTSGEVDQLLSSSYLYVVVDLMIKSQDTLTLPDTAYETTGDYTGMIKKTEVQDVFLALNILGISDLSTVDPATITIGDISDVLTQTDSAVVQSLLSQAIIDALDPNDEGKIPDDAYEGDPADGLLSSAEIDALIAGLDILGGGDPDALITDIDVATITVGDVDNLSDTESTIIKQLISDAIVDALGAGLIPDEAYGLSSSSNSGTTILSLGNVQLAGTAAPRLTDAELQAMIDALVILANNDLNVLVTDISTDVNVGQAVQLKGTESYIIKQLITDNISDVLSGTSTLPAEAFVDGDVNGRLLDAEIDSMIDAMVILANGDLNLAVTSISTDIDVGQVKDLVLLPSIVTKQLISDQVIDQIDPLDEGKIPDEARIGGISTNRLTDTEILSMVDALEILAGHDDNVLVTAISTDVNVGQVKELKGTSSFIIKQLVSDSVVDVIGVSNIPLESYIGSDSNNRLTDVEIDAMIDALDILGEDSVLVTNISTDVTVGQTKELKGTSSFIIKQMVSDAVVDVIGISNIPLESYIDSDSNNRLTDSEIDAMIDALDILGEDSVLVTAISTDVNVGQAVQFKGTPSYIIKQLLSDAIIDAIDPLDEGKIPDIAHIDSDPLKRLTDSEIDAMIDAIDVLANGDQNLLVTNISTDVSIGQVKGLNDLTSSITTQLISDAIIDAVGVANVPDDAYLLDTPGNNLKSTEVDAMILALEVLAGSTVPGDVDHILVASVSTDVTIGQTQALDTSGTGSSIIKFIISDSIITMITEPKIPASAYNTTYTDRLSDQEITDMLAVLSILGDSEDPVSTISTDINIGQLKSLNASPSLIMEKLISDSIIDAVGVASVPMDAYVDGNSNNYLTEDEISAMILAIEILSGSTTPGDVDHVLVSSISTDVTIGQTQALDTSGTGSSIIKFIISDSIITMITAPKIPADAYHLTYTDRLSDQEITDMLAVLGILGDSEDPVSTISTDINIGQLKSLNASPSLIMEKLISDSIIDAVGLANVPADAYIDEDSNNYLTEDEISAMILAIEILSGSTTPGDVDHVFVSSVSTDVTIGQTQALDTSGTGSSIIKFIISDSIITMITEPKIPASAYNTTYTDRLSDQEITDMLGVLGYLGASTDPVSSIDVDITIGQLKDIKSSPSLIMTKLISDSIIDAVGLANVPDDAYISDTSGNNLKATEVDNMILALEVFAGSIVPGDQDATKISTISTANVTVGQTQDLATNSSAIIKFIISDSVITMFGSANIPVAAYHIVYTDRLSDEEIVAIAVALGELGNPNDSVTSLSTDVTVAQTQALDTTATGSYTIKQMISNSIIDVLGSSRIPSTAYVIDTDPLDRLIDSEIGYMQESLLSLAGGNSATLVSAITVNESTLSVSTLQDFPEESIILNRMISTALIDGISNIPDESFTELVFKLDIKRPEINSVLEALDYLGIGTSGAGGIGTADITFSELDYVIALGTGDLVNYPLGYSPIINHILSTPMISAVSDIRSGHEYGIPTTAYTNAYDLDYNELVKLIDGLKVIGEIPPNDPATTTLAAAVFGLNPSAFGPDILTELITVDSLIIYRMISIGINDSNIDTLESRAVLGDTNYDDGLPALPEIYDIKITEMSHIVVSMNILGITDIGNIASQITVAKLKALSPAETELLVEAIADGPNTIIYYLIADIIDSSLSPAQKAALVSNNDYVMDGLTPIRIKRASIVTALALL
ncbi:MAG: hypothetical protein JXC31_00210 [Acholeplasmataceae bacterium]|nr:hypothetical protein [Acholeplasmataceae bacterium]